MLIICKKCEREIGKVAVKGNVVRYLSSTGILSMRKRFDGEWGFQCACGNNSLLCEAEKGIITSDPPTAEDIKEIEKRLKKNPSNCELTSDGYDCDGFIWKGDDGR